MYSSCRGTRLARISAIPYMPTVNSSAAPRNHSSPAPLVWKSIPRSSANPISVTTCSAVTAIATSRFAITSSDLGTGAASSSRCAPLSRSTIALSPENIVFSGISRPTVPIAT